MALLDAAPRRVSAGWSGLLADLSAEGGDAASGMLHAFVPPPAPGPRADGTPAAAGACWTDVLELDGEFGLEAQHATQAPGGAEDTHGFLEAEHASELMAHDAQLSHQLLPPPCVDADGLRCLDATHGAECSRCVRGGHCRGWCCHKSPPRSCAASARGPRRCCSRGRAAHVCVRRMRCPKRRCTASVWRSLLRRGRIPKRHSRPMPAPQRSARLARAPAMPCMHP